MAAYPERSELSVPASRPDMIEKALRMPADVVFLDLEDGVAPAMKGPARQNVIDAVRRLDWGDKPPAFRINGLRTPYAYRDVIEVVEAVGDRLELIVVPKVESLADLAALDLLLHGIELARDLPRPIALEAQIESAAGLLAVDAIAGSTPRLRSLIFGPGDFAASMRMPAANIGSPDSWDEQYGSHRFHEPMLRIATAARAHGLRVIDGPVADIRNPDAYRRSCLIARALGYDGKWCIHPTQIPIANEIFSPSEDEVSWARRVIDAYEGATQSGRGAVTLDGQMIDAASVALARSTLGL